MSIAARAACDASSMFDVEVLLRWAAFMITSRISITAARTVRVIISSMSVNPRAWERRDRVLREKKANRRII